MWAWGPIVLVLFLPSVFGQCELGHGGLDCQACEAGKFKNVSDSSACLPCAGDTWSGPAAVECQACPAGWSNRVALELITQVWNGYGGNTPIKAANGSLILQTPKPSEAWYAQHGAAATARPLMRATGSVQLGVLARPLTPGPLMLNVISTGLSSTAEIVFDDSPEFQWRFTKSRTPSTAIEDLIFWIPAVGARLEVRSVVFGISDPLRDYVLGNHTAACKLCKEGYYRNTDGECEQCPTGRFAPVPGRAVCEECRIDTYADSPGTAKCTTCPSGRAIPYIGGTNVTECSDCRGGYTDDGAGGCVACGLGKYKDWAGPDPCAPCRVNYYAASTGRTACSSCSNAGGTGNVTGATSVNQCVICKAGLKGTVGPTGCKPCDAGRYKDWSGPADVCIDCVPGKYTRALRATTCLDCPNGSAAYYTGASACSTCLLGFTPRTVVAAGDTTASCLACVPGRFKDTIGDEVCTPCPEDTYTAASGRKKIEDCIACPANSATNGAEGATVCKCRPGFYSASTVSPNCKACTAGKYAAEWATTECIMCPTGSNTLSTGASSCTVCAAGYEGEPPASCTACPPGKFKAASGIDPCAPCAAGKYSSSTTVCSGCSPASHHDTAATPAGSKLCVCAVGWARTTATATACTVCAPGYGGASCTPCPDGSFSAGGTLNPCNACPAGEYSEDNTCYTCNNATFLHVSIANTLTGSYRCACATGWARANADELDCTVCDEGYEWTGSTCAACSAGKYKAAIGNTLCQTCAADKYSTAAAGGCLSCPVGSTTNGATGQAACTTCLAGFTRVVDACVVCPAGTYKGALGNSACTSCPSATSVSSNTTPGAQTEIEACRCKPGYKPGTGAKCVACGANTFKATTGNVDCSVCGSCNSCDAASGNCTACGEGQTPQGNKCVECAAGKYKITTDGSACIPCEFGASGCSKCAPTTGDCTACPAGKIPLEKGCDDCDARTYKTTADGANCNQCALLNGCTACNAATGDCTACPKGLTVSGQSCIECPVNTYKSTTNGAACQACSMTNGCLACNVTSGACTSCPTGFAPNGVGCTACAAGKYKSTVGQDQCTACEMGNGCLSCSPETGFCLSCPTGKQLNPSGTGCEACATGTFKATVGTAVCVDCNLADPGRAGCLACSPHTGACAECPPGKSPDGNSCGDCASGMYKPLEATVCEACPISAPCESCSPLSGKCTSCPAATEISSSQYGCTACAAGTFKTLAGAAECHACPLDDACTACSATSGECTACPAGKAVSGTGCVDCAARTFKASADDADCTACPVDELCLSCAADTGKCTACPQGYESNGDQTGCIACAPGRYKARDDGGSCEGCDLANDCLSCSPLTGACTSCPEGTQVQGIGCSDCPAGMFKDTVGDAPCESCNTESECLACSPVTGECIACPAGSAPVGTECKACEAGLYKATSGPGSCNDCPLANECLSCSATTGECLACPAGKAISGVGCEDCPSGSYSLDGQVCVSCELDQPSRAGCSQCDSATGDCTACPLGAVVDGYTCTVCPAGQYTPTAGSPCQACTRDNGCTACAATTGQCTACPASFTPSGEGCAACGAGSYKSTNDDAGCISCNLGDPSLSGCTACSPTSGLCTQCLAGSVPDGTKCTACASGRFATAGTSSCEACSLLNGCLSCSSSTGQCISCPAGSFAENDGCAGCAAGKFKATTGGNPCSGCDLTNGCLSCSSVSGECLACPAGKYISGTGCADCTAGFFCSGGSAAPALCASLHRSTNGPLVSECGACSAGYFGTPSGASACSECPAGSYCPAGTAEPLACVSLHRNGAGAAAASCGPCVPSYFGSVQGVDSCSECALDDGCTHCNQLTGACTACPGGFSPHNEGCKACDTGFYKTTTDGAACVSCNLGANNCLACAPTSGLCVKCASGLKPNGQQCAACGAGWYKDVDQTDCQRCALENGCTACSVTNGTCTACPAGSTPSGNGCVACAAGFFKSASNGATCQPCDASCPNCNVATGLCLKCPAGAEPSGMKCTDCAAGKFKATEDGDACTSCDGSCPLCDRASGVCLKCPAGMTPADMKCKACPKGTFKASEDGSLCLVCPPMSTPGCLTCSATDGGCLSCKAGYTLNQGLCIAPITTGSTTAPPVYFTFVTSESTSNETAVESVLDRLSEELGIDRAQLVFERVEGGRVHVRIDPVSEPEKETDSVPPADIFKAIQEMAASPTKAAALGMDPTSIARTTGLRREDVPITINTIFDPNHLTPVIICAALLLVWIFGVVMLQSTMNRARSAIKRYSRELPVYQAFLPREVPLGKRLLGNLSSNLPGLSAFASRVCTEQSAFPPLVRWSIWISSLYVTFACAAVGVYTSVIGPDNNSGNSGGQAAVAGFIASIFCLLYSWAFSHPTLLRKSIVRLIVPVSLATWILTSLLVILICGARFQTVWVESSGNKTTTSVASDWVLASFGGLLFASLLYQPIGILIITLLRDTFVSEQPSTRNSSAAPHLDSTRDTSSEKSRSSGGQISAKDGPSVEAAQPQEQPADPLDQWMGEIAARQLESAGGKRHSVSQLPATQRQASARYSARDRHGPVEQDDYFDGHSTAPAPIVVNVIQQVVHEHYYTPSDDVAMDESTVH